MIFVDTNVLIYATSPDPGEAAKRRRATDILLEGDVSFSAQVLQEFYVQATRPTRNGALSHADAELVVARLARRPLQPITSDLVRAAISTCRRFQVSYWDAAILEAARALGCAVVLSEDLGDGTDYGGVRVENPFRDC